MTSNRIRLLSFLGLPGGTAPNFYTPVRYQMDTALRRSLVSDARADASAPAISDRTPLVAVALRELIAPHSRIVFLGTQCVHKRWLQEEFEGRPNLYHHLPEDAVHFNTISTGGEISEAQAIFTSVRQWLSPDPRPELGETSAPDQIVVDVTNGFRIQPMLALAAIAFEQSAWQRQADDQEPPRPRIRILYGAFDPRSQSNAPEKPTDIWDLTHYSDVSQWNVALNSLLRYGRADDLETLLTGIHDTRREEALRGVPHPRETGGRPLPEYLEARATDRWLPRLGREARSFADDIATLRAESVITNRAQELRKVLASARDASAAESDILQLLKEPLAELERWSADLQADHLFCRDGLRSMAHLAQICFRHERYNAVLIIAAETCALIWAWLDGDEKADAPLFFEGSRATASGTAADKAVERYQSASFALNAALHDRQSTPRNQDSASQDLAEHIRTKLISLAQKTKDRRNDVGHAGLRKQQDPSDAIRNRSREIVKELVTLCQELPAEPPARPKTCAPTVAPQEHMLANLSNHPIRTWPTAQYEAAEALIGRPIDIPGFATVAPSAEPEEVIEQARALVSRTEELGATDAYVAGEPTLVSTLVAMLQRRDIRCWTATTERIKSEKTLHDGTIESVMTFRFERWRRYPALGDILTGERNRH